MTDNTTSKLLVSEAESSQKIGRQINIGNELLERQLFSEQEFNILKGDTKKWIEYNKTMFDHLFDKSPLPWTHGVANSYTYDRGLDIEIPDHRKAIERWINELESIYEQLDLYTDLPSNTQQSTNQNITPNNQTKYFIGHGGSPEWLKLKDFLEKTLKLPYEEFNRIPQAGKITSVRLKEMLESCCMAFLIMTGEDEHTDGTLHARSNVIHEIGLFQAQLGYERAIILLEKGCEVFSNIDGITYISFPKGNIRAAFEDIRDVLKRERIIKEEPV